MNGHQYRTWATLHSIKALFGYRSGDYRPVVQLEGEESKCSIDGDTSCLEENTFLTAKKSSLSEHFDNVNMKQIEEILPLVTEKSFGFQTQAIPTNTYSNDTRPDVDLLEC